MKKRKIISSVLAVTCAISSTGIPTFADNKNENTTVVMDQDEDTMDETRAISNSSIEIEVISASSEKPVENVEIELFKDDESVGTYTTDSDGMIIVENIELGNYSFKTISAPEEYVIETNKTYQIGNITQSNVTAKFTLKLGDSVSQKNDVTFTTVETDNEDNVIPGVLIGFYDENKKELGTYTTSEDGSITINDLTEGTYYYKVISVPDGYKIGTVTGSFNKLTLTKDNWIGNVSISILSDSEVTERTVSIKCIDQESKSAISNATFGIYEDDTKLGSFTTDENGEASYTVGSGLSYIIKEESMPEGYVTDTTKEYKITFSSSGATKGNITIQKIKKETDSVKLSFSDASTGETLTGITILVTDKNDSSKTYEFTDVNGIIDLKTLPSGSYKFEITNVPDGYEGVGMYADVPTDADLYEFKLNQKEKASSGSLILHMKEAGTNTDIANVKILVTNNNDFNKTIVTDENGDAVLKNIPFGTYTWKVIDATEDYILPTTSYSFTLTENSSIEETGLYLVSNSKAVPTQMTFYEKGTTNVISGTISGTVYADDQTTKISDFTTDNGIADLGKLNPGSTYYVKITNVPNGYVKPTGYIYFTVKAGSSFSVKTELNQGEEAKDYSLNMTVKDENGNIITGTTKARFYYIENGKESTEIGIYTSENGIITLEHITSRNIGYQLVEVPDSYYLSTGKYTITLPDVFGTYQTDITLQKQDTITGVLTVIVKDDDGNYIPGVGIKVKQGNIEKQTTTDEEGKAVFNDLPVGNYSYEIVSVPEGYQKPSKNDTLLPVSDTPLQFTYTLLKSTARTSATQIFKFYDNKDTENKTQLSGFTLKVYKESGEEVGNVSVDAAGTVTIENLEKGNYYFVITGTPENYSNMMSYKNNFTISDYTTKTTTVKLQKDAEQTTGTFEMTVVDDGNNPVKDVEVTITGSDGSKKVVKTNEKGVASVSDLENGTYTYKISNVSNIYYENTKEYSFTINDSIKSFKANIVLTRVSGTVSVNVKEGTSFVTKGKVIIKNTDTNEEQYQMISNNIINFVNLKASNYEIRLEDIDNVYKTPEKQTFTISATNNTENINFNLVRKVGNIQFSVSQNNADVNINVYNKNGVLLKQGRTSNGILLISDLTYGDYYYTVSSVPDEYQDITTQTDFTVDDDLNVLPINLKKVTCIFDVDILDNNNEKVNGTITATLKNKNTGDIRTINITNSSYILYDLEPGTYIFTVTSLPEDYVGTFTKEFTVNKQITRYSLDLTCQKKEYGYVTVNASDGTNSINNVTYKITNLNTDEVVYNGITSTNAAKIKLEYGSYRVDMETPTGYKANDGTSFILNVNSDSLDKVIYFTKIINGICNVNIVDENNKKLENVTVRIQGDNVDKTLVTNTSGSVSFTNMDAGTYYVTVSNLPSSYQEDSRSYEMTVTKDNQTPGITIVAKAKKDNLYTITMNIKNGKEMVDGTIDLYNGSEKVGTYRTTNGTAIITGLAEGEYTYVVKLDDSYVAIDNGTILLQYGEDQTINLNTTKKLSAITVKAVDTDTKELVGSVDITVDGKQYSLNKGSINFNLEYGTHTITINSIPDNYTLDDLQTFTFKVSENTKTLELFMTKKNGNVTIQLKDGNSNTYISDGTIVIYNSDKTENTRKNVNKNGAVISLKPGNYYYKVLGSALYDETDYIPFTVESNISSNFEKTLARKTGELKISTSDEVGNKIPNAKIKVIPENVKLETTEFEITNLSGGLNLPYDAYQYVITIPDDYEIVSLGNIKALSGTLTISDTSKQIDFTGMIVKKKDTEKPSISITVKDEDGNPMKNTEITVSEIVSENQSYDQTYKTDETGRIYISNLAYGTYRIHADSKINGYSVFVDKTIQITEQNKTVNLEITAEKYRTTGIVKAKVMDSNGNPIKNATIGIWQGTEIYKTYTTDDSGQIQIEIPLGDYKIGVYGEIHGYTVNTSLTSFSLTDKVSSFEMTYHATKKADTELGTLTTTFTDQNNNILQNQKVKVIKTVGKDTETNEYMTDQNGQIKFKREENNATYQFIIDSSKEYEDYYNNYKETLTLNKMISVASNTKYNNMNTTITANHEIVKTAKEIKSNINVLVKDEENKGIANVTVGFYDNQNTLVYTKLTDKNGKINLSETGDKDYTIKIVKVPDGYQLKANTSSVNWNNKNPIKTMEFVSVLSKIEIPVIDRTTKIVIKDSNGTKISGVVINVKGNNFDKNYTTDENGEIAIKNLPDGEYEITQVSVPNGYVKSTETKKLTINGNIDTELNFTNKKTTSNSGSSSGGSSGSHSGGSSGGSSGGLGSSGSSKNTGSNIGPGSSNTTNSVTGTWDYDQSKDKWTLNHNSYKNQWVYAYNPYSQGNKNDWFRFDENGYMVTGWFTDVDGLVYYLNETSDGTRGKMVTQWNWINGKCYYFSDISDGTRGHLLKNTTTPDGYQVDQTGAWIVNGVQIVR